MRFKMTPLTWQSALHRPSTARPLIMAHRGASDELPENTLAAFQLALEQGADILETDIRLTRDNEIILMHDATVDRTTNGTGAVANLTLAEIKNLHTRRPQDPPLRVGEGVGGEVHHPRPISQKAGEVPTLAEFLEFTATQSNPVPIALELKDDRFIQPRAADQLLRVLEQHHALARAVLLSFHGERVRACKRLAPQIPIGIITLKNPFPLYDTELMGPFYPLLFLNPLYFAWAKRRGKLACPLDPAPEPRLKYYRRIGAPALLTNHPAVTIRAWEALYQEFHPS